jgi:hypothetical protein
MGNGKRNSGEKQIKIQIKKKVKEGFYPKIIFLNF